VYKYRSCRKTERWLVVVGGPCKPHGISFFCHCAVSCLPETVKCFTLSPATRTLQSYHVRMSGIASFTYYAYSSISLPSYERNDMSVTIPERVCNVRVNKRKAKFTSDCDMKFVSCFNPVVTLNFLLQI
jgi:hypothetical protein